MLNEKTKENLRRKSAYVDHVQLTDGIPLFSWIDINLTELCNRACVFCPRVDPAVYPNQNLNMSPALMRKIADELRQLNYQGCVVFCGYGEPMLHPQLAELSACLGDAARLELVTNGDRLTPAAARKLFDSGVDYFVVSMYDGPQQIDHFHKVFAEAGCPKDSYILRDRWHAEEDGFGLKLTNRAGMVTIGQQEAVDVSKPCHYPAYSMTVDWNGDVLLCVQDWHKKVKLGNVYAQSLLEIWKSRALMKIRSRLADGRRTEAPCNGCNADGTLHGFNHVDAWGFDRPGIAGALQEQEQEQEQNT